MWPFLRPVVVRIDLRSEFHLLDDRMALILAILSGLQRGFVLVLAVIHEFADRRFGHRGHFDEVELRLFGQPQRIVDTHDANLLAAWTDQSDLGHADPLIDPGFDADGRLLCSQR